MPSIHRKLKLAFIMHHPDDGLTLTVTAKDGERLDMVLSPGDCAMLLKQLVQGVQDGLPKAFASSRIAAPGAEG